MSFEPDFVLIFGETKVLSDLPTDLLHYLEKVYVGSWVNHDPGGWGDMLEQRVSAKAVVHAGGEEQESMWRLMLWYALSLETFTCVFFSHVQKMSL